MVEEKKKGGFLPWPWNVVVYILLAVVFRLFSIPIILFLMWLRQKNNPHGVEEGYCLSRTRKRLTGLLWSLLLLALAVCLAVFFLDGMSTDRAYWEARDYVTLVVSGGGTVILAAAGIYLGYTALRDSLFPARSALARSIRDQLPDPDDAPEVGELFAMVDGDLKEHGQWFGPVGIGKEWVLGDEANRIDRIRGIFTVDKVQVRNTQTGTRTSRTLELVLIDDRWRKSSTAFRDPEELRAAAELLALRVPAARRGTNDQYLDFLHMDRIEQDHFDREFQREQERLTSARAQAEATAGAQDMILKRRSGEVTSRVDNSLVEDALQRCLRRDEVGFALIPTRPIPGGASGFRALDCQITAGDGQAPAVLLTLSPAGAGEPNLTLTADGPRAAEILQGWLRREALNLTGWRARPANTAPEPPQTQTRKSHARLSLVYASGAAENHTTFTQEDVQIAADGIADGTYQLVELVHPVGYLWIRVTAGEGSTCTVEATRPGGPELEFYRAKMPPEEAAVWLTGYPAGEYLPGGPRWENITKQVMKQGERGK